MVLIKEEIKEMCDNGICSICGNDNAVVYWSGAKGLGFCPECMEDILPDIVGDYIFYALYHTHKADRVSIKRYRDIKSMLEKFNYAVYQNVLAHVDVRLKNEIKRKCEIENKLNMDNVECCCDRWYGHREFKDYICEYCPECGEKFIEK